MKKHPCWRMRKYSPRKLASMYGFLDEEDFNNEDWWDVEEGVEDTESIDLRNAEVIEIEPVVVIVHGRLYRERLKAYRVGDKIFVKEEDYESLF